MDDKIKLALERLYGELHSVREEVILHTQFRRNTAVSPLDPNWGKPNPIDLNGVVGVAFWRGVQAAREAAKGAKDAG